MHRWITRISRRNSARRSSGQLRPFRAEEPGIAIYMAVTVVFLALIGIGIQNYYDLTYENEEYTRVLSQPNWQLQDLRNKEQWELTHYCVRRER